MGAGGGAHGGGLHGAYLTALDWLQRREGMLAIGTLIAIVLAAGTAYVIGSGGAPTLPYVPVGFVHQVPEPVLDQDLGVLFVPADGELRAFDASGATLSYCAKSDRLESEDGRVWDLEGRALDGGTSLQPYRVKVHDTTIYLDRSGSEPAPEPADQGATAMCR